MNAPIGSSASCGSSVPSGSGASASAGVIRTSYWSTNVTSSRPTPCSWKLGQQRVDRVDALAQLVERPAQRLHVVGRRLAARDHLGELDLRADRRPERRGEDRRQLRPRPRRVGLDDLVTRATPAAPRRPARPGRTPGRPARRGPATATSSRSAACRASRPAARRERLGRRRRPASCRPASGPCSTSSTSAVSRTVRVSTPSLHQEDLPDLGRQRDPAALGLEADQPAARRRDPRRAAAVVGVGDRDHPGRDRRRAAAAGAARRARLVPRVARRAEARGLGRRQDAPLGQRRRPDDDEARGLQPRDDVVVVGRDEVADEVRRRTSAAGPRPRGCS